MTDETLSIGVIAAKHKAYDLDAQRFTDDQEASRLQYETLFKLACSLSAGLGINVQTDPELPIENDAQYSPLSLFWYQAVAKAEGVDISNVDLPPGLATLQKIFTMPNQD